jgi:hypothetical protein
MMTHLHGIEQEDTMQAVGAKRATLIRKPLQFCSTQLNSLAELYTEVRLMGAPVRKRELPQGARARFMEAIASSASITPFPVAEETPINAFAKIPIKKKSLFPLNSQELRGTGKVANARSRVKTVVVAASNAVAARIAGIF